MWSPLGCMGPQMLNSPKWLPSPLACYLPKIGPCTLLPNACFPLVCPRSQARKISEPMRTRPYVTGSWWLILPCHRLHADFLLLWFFTPNLVVIHSSETSAHMWTTQHCIPEDGIMLFSCYTLLQIDGQLSREACSVSRLQSENFNIYGRSCTESKVRMLKLNYTLFTSSKMLYASVLVKYFIREF
jgi:hypothetical protein